MKILYTIILVLFIFSSNLSLANTPSFNKTTATKLSSSPNSISFDIPITYNSHVSKWVRYFQGKGRKWFQVWLDRSKIYMPHIHRLLDRRNLPRDLAYLAMIESGYSAKAISSASAVGYWQFILPTAKRYGLKHSWWIDERRDIIKSTWAASQYLNDLNNEFQSWYLAASAYNMGETRLRRLIKKHNTRDFWALSQKYDFPKETRDYIPKLIAATMIAKAPNLYGFKAPKGKVLEYNYFYVPGGTDLFRLAEHLGIERAQMLKLNPELLHGLVPAEVSSHRIRIPVGMAKQVASFVNVRNLSF